MDQHEDIPPTSQNTSPPLENRSILQLQENKAIEFKKPVRTRISYSQSQQVILEREFQGSAYIYRSRRMEIAARLGIEEKHVKVWFQNRRMKSKKETLQNRNKMTSKKPAQFLVPAELRKVQEKNAKNNINLPVHKPMAAQLVKGVCHNVPKVFKPQLIVQMPVPVTQPSKSQIYQATSPSSIQDDLRQLPAQQQQHQLQKQVPQQQFLHQVQQVLQQALDVQHKLQQHQPCQQPKFEVPHLNPAPSTIIPKGTSIDRLKNPECSEESFNLDRYLNDLEQRVEALKKEEQKQQQQTIMKIQQDLSDCVEEFDDLSNAAMPMAALSPKIDDDFDLKNLLDDLDRYVSYPGTAPELDFDDSLFSQDLISNNCSILKYDPTLPLMDFSFDDWALVGH